MSSPPLNPIVATSLAVDGIRHGFFTREGGVSGGLYTSLNAGLGSRDDPDAVIENRARVARHLGARDERVLTLHQVHSAIALIVDRHIPRAELPKADALVTATPGLVIGALAADCAPVLFCDPQARVIGAAHAGWRGALGGVLEATVDAIEQAGGRRERVRAALGPCIGPAAYEVGPEFVDNFLAADPANKVYFFTPEGAPRPYFDLPGYVIGRLNRLGLSSVENASACTHGDSQRFFSYRRSTQRQEPDYGRQISAIVVA